MTFNAIQCHDIDQHTKALADYLPGGKLWAAKNIEDTTLRNLLKGISREMLRSESYLKALQDEFIPDETENFIEDWERALAIPDDCFDAQGTLSERRRDILVKLASLGVQTSDDFEALALQFGIVANVVSGTTAAVFPITFPFTFIDSPRFTIIVEFVTSNNFPYTFPLTFGNDTIVILECLFNKLKPANCEVLFVQI